MRVTYAIVGVVAMILAGVLGMSDAYAYGCADQCRAQRNARTTSCERQYNTQYTFSMMQVCNQEVQRDHDACIQRCYGAMMGPGSLPSSRSTPLPPYSPDSTRIRRY